MWTPHFDRCVPTRWRKLVFFILFGENLIFRKKLGVATYFYFIFKGKNKIRKKNPKCDSKSFSKNQIFTKQNKKASFLHRMGTHRAKYGVNKMATPLRIFRGSNLNSSWGECGVWLVDQWILLSMCLGMIVCWLHVESFDMFVYNICLAIMFICDVDMLITSFDSLVYFSIVTLLVIWLFCFPGHVYSHFCISHSSWHDWFYLLYIILFISTYYLFLLYSCLAYHILA